MGRASRRKQEKPKGQSFGGEGVPFRSGSRSFLSRPSVVLSALVFLTLLLYGNTLSFPFQFDDTDNILENPGIRRLFSLLDFSGTRSIGFLTFALNYHFGDLDPFGYHLVNLLIHSANGFLVYSLVLLLYRTCELGQTPSSHSSWIALFTALLFIVHPIQTQAVTYIVQRFASLVTLFYLLSVVCYLKYRTGYAKNSVKNKQFWYVASLLSTFLAMKTKENSFTLPFMILLVEAVFFRSVDKIRWKAVIPFFLLAAPIIPLSHQNALGEAEGFARDTTELTRLDYLFTQFRVIVTYLRLLILPIRQNLDYHYPVFHSLFQPAVLVSCLFLLGLFVFAVRHVRRVGHVRLISFGILWFFLTLSVESSIIPIKDVIFEHRVYLPSAGFFLSVVLVVFGASERWRGMRWPLVVCGLLLLTSLSVATYGRNRVWADAVTLWRDVVEKSPRKGRGYSNLGSALQAEGKIDEAIGAYETALRLYPNYPQAHNNLGSALLEKGRTDEAVLEYEAALKVKPDIAEAHYNLGFAFAKQGRTDEAIREYETALKLRPEYAKALTNLGAIHATGGRLEEASREFEAVLKLRPASAEAHSNLGNVFLLQGRLEEAIKRYQEALRLRPDFAEARNNLDMAIQKREQNAHPLSE